MSRSLAGGEGALLVVDAAQGVEAQTVANVYLALDNDLTLIAVINKIDLPGAMPDQVEKEISDLIGLLPEEIIRASAKTGFGINEVLEAIVQHIPPPTGDASAPLQALVFDSHYDPYKGVVAYVKIEQGTIPSDSRIRMMATKKESEVIEIGAFRPDMKPMKSLSAGEVGYVATGFKTVGDCQVGDTITLATNPAAAPLPGYRPAKPMVFAGFFPVESDEYPELRDALERLQLNDASLIFEAESSDALGFGFRCGFLGLLHMEIVQERLEREYELDLLATAPSVEYEVVKTNGDIVRVDNPSDLPDPGEISDIREPYMDITIISPSRYIGTMMDLVTGRRGEYELMEYLDEDRVSMKFVMPLGEVIVEFYDQLKSRSQGYASLDYQFREMRAGNLVKLDVLVNGQSVDALSVISHRDEAYFRGRELVAQLRKLIPRQMFDVPIQASIGSRIVARETVKAMRKNVLSKCYGGDVTRKRKLLEKQREGKQRMKMVGNVEIPQEAFMSVLTLGSGDKALSER